MLLESISNDDYQSFIVETVRATMYTKSNEMFKKYISILPSQELHMAVCATIYEYADDHLGIVLKELSDRGDQPSHESLMNINKALVQTMHTSMIKTIYRTYDMTCFVEEMFITAITSHNREIVRYILRKHGTALNDPESYLNMTDSETMKRTLCGLC